MSYITENLSGDRICQKTKTEFCSNNPQRISSHICYKSENIQLKDNICLSKMSSGYFVNHQKPNFLVFGLISFFFFPRNIMLILFNKRF